MVDWQAESQPARPGLVALQGFAGMRLSHQARWQKRVGAVT